MKKCNACNAQYADTETRCPGCGGELAAEQPSASTVVPVRKTNIVMVVVIAVLLVLVGFLGGLLLMQSSGNSKEDPAPSSDIAAETESRDLHAQEESEQPLETAAPATEPPATEPPTEPETPAPTEPPTAPPPNYMTWYGGWILQDADTLNQGSMFREYYVYDINGDGVYEIILRMGSCEADAVFKFWTIVDDELVFCGTLGAGHTGLQEKDGVLYTNLGMMGYQVIDEICMDEENMVYQVNYFDSGDTMMEEYIDVGNNIPGYDFADLTGVVNLQ